MPMFRALQLCPDAVVIPPDMAKYKLASERIRTILLAATPVIEPVSLDEAYLDLSADVRLSDRPAAVLLAGIARAVEREVGITVSIGLSFNKFLAKLASDLDKPRGFAVIGRSEAMDVSGGAAGPQDHGRRRGDRARLRSDRHRDDRSAAVACRKAGLVAWFGGSAAASPGSPRGEDNRKVIASRPAKSISAETTFASDIRALRAAGDGSCVRSAIASQAGWRTPGSPAAPSSSSSRPPTFRC